MYIRMWCHRWIKAKNAFVLYLEGTHILSKHGCIYIRMSVVRIVSHFCYNSGNQEQQMMASTRQSNIALWYMAFSSLYLIECPLTYLNVLVTSR